MFKVDKTKFGFKLTVEGFMQPDEAQKISKEVKNAVAGRTEGFGVLVDLRNSNVMPRDSQMLIKQLMGATAGAGMTRSAVVMSNPIAALQVRRLASESGIQTQERHIDASKDPNWEKTALDWIEGGIDPYEKG